MTYLQELEAAEAAALADVTTLVTRLQAAADAGETATMRALARDIHLAMAHAHRVSDHAGQSDLRTIDDTIEELYDHAFPVGDDDDAVTVLAGPWPTLARQRRLKDLLGIRYVQADLDPIAEQAAADGDVRTLTLTARSQMGQLSTEVLAQTLAALHAADALDDDTIDDAITADHRLAWMLNHPGRASRLAAVAERLRPHFHERLWQATDPGLTDAELPQPRGLRFVLRALDDDCGDWRLRRRLGAATLTTDERTELVALLAGRDQAGRERALTFRAAAGDGQALLGLLGYSDAGRLLTLVRLGVAPSRVLRQDRAALTAATAQAGPAAADALLKLLPNDVAAAATGRRRAEIMKRVATDSPLGLAAYGMLPLADGETVLARFLDLCAIHQRGIEFPPERGHTHGQAVHVAMSHLAQVAGLREPTDLDLAAQSGSGVAATMTVTAGPYTVTSAFVGPEPTIAASKAGRTLKTLPKAVRSDPGYPALAAHRELLRGQGRRMRTGPLERLVATGTPVTPDELARWRELPAGAAMLPLLLWRDHTGRHGLLDEIDHSGPITAAHPVTLHAAGLLSHWQTEIVRRGLRQPVAQLFREWQLPDPLDATNGLARFVDLAIEGIAAAQALTARGWTIYDGDGIDGPYATKPAGQHTAVLSCGPDGGWGLDEIHFERLRYRSGDAEALGRDIDPVACSEVLRDLDHTVRQESDPSAPQFEARARSRADLLTAILNVHKLTSITLDGLTAVAHGTQPYRLRLLDGDVRVGPEQRECSLPHDFGGKPHPLIAEVEHEQHDGTTKLLHRVLLLAEDDKITDVATLYRLGLREEVLRCYYCGETLQNTKTDDHRRRAATTVCPCLSKNI